jgi:hypothetical protein
VRSGINFRISVARSENAMKGQENYTGLTININRRQERGSDFPAGCRYPQRQKQLYH